jgi:YggT family protein
VAILGALAHLLVLVLWLLVLGRLLLSWVDPGGGNPVAAFLTRTTEPILAPVGRALPRTGSIDWSGFLVLIVLGLLWRAF